MKPLVALVGALAAVLVWSGCSTPQTRISQNPDLFSRLPAQSQSLVKQGRIAVGFSPEMVKLALGEPDDVIRNSGPLRDATVWVYHSPQPAGITSPREAPSPLTTAPSLPTPSFRVAFRKDTVVAFN